MIARLKRLFLLLCLIVILAFVFSDSMLYYCSRWHEKTGDVKRAVSGYRELLRKHPGSRWAQKAREAIDRLKQED